ncbi:universal stress protein [Pseudomonas paraeruginosa]|uniref:universal stress protein n=1 Tax=Pseudomonas paraeruginosa TaxID=2994495 RepID=UPI0039FDCCC1
MNLQNLLVVIDPSSDEQPALTRAQWIAERSGASVELLLCDFNPALDGGLFFDSHSLRRARDLYLDERVTWLEQLSMPLQQAGLRTRVEALWGKPLDRMVLQRVDETRPDLVLKSTRRHNLLRRLLLGNSDWQLIRHCPQPLWLVHHDTWRGQRLCAALDPLHASDKPAALDHQLIAAAERLEASLGLRADYLHAYAAMPRSLLFDAEMLAGYDRFVLQHEERHRQAFDDLLAAYPQVAAERRHLLAGYAEQAIPDFVRANDIDLLLMGAVARGHLDNALIGQTAERVLEEVECDLLVLKPTNDI